MLKAPIPKNEKQRLASLYAFKLLDTKQEERFDRITLIATKIFHVPISTLTLIDANREWFKSCQGLKKREGDRAISFCGHAVLNGNLFIIEDTRKDPRFSDNPMVVGKPFIRFYAGVPIKSADGARIGVFCIKDTKPRSLSENEKEILTGLAKWAELEINSRNLRLILDEVEKGKSKNEAILQSIGDGAIAIDQTGNILFANDNALRMLKLKRKEAIGSNYKDLWQVVNEKGDILEFDKRPIQRAIKFRRKVITDPKHICYYVRLDKTQIPVSITVAPL
ncbi:PAS domain-containing protein [Candidatus Uhrbacteria bacterium]|nr:PAS domain-containing protein [Candidatus Uhrbacteria bacterium]